MSCPVTSTALYDIQTVPSGTCHPYRLRSESNTATCAVLTRRRYRTGPGCFRPGHSHEGRTGGNGRGRSQRQSHAERIFPISPSSLVHFDQNIRRTPTWALATNYRDGSFRQAARSTPDYSEIQVPPADTGFSLCVAPHPASHSGHPDSFLRTSIVSCVFSASRLYGCPGSLAQFFRTQTSFCLLSFIDQSEYRFLNTCNFFRFFVTAQELMGHPP